MEASLTCLLLEYSGTGYGEARMPDGIVNNVIAVAFMVGNSSTLENAADPTTFAAKSSMLENIQKKPNAFRHYCMQDRPRTCHLSAQKRPAEQCTTYLARLFHRVHFISEGKYIQLGRFTCNIC